LGHLKSSMYFRVRTGDEKSLNLVPGPWKDLNSDSEKKSLESPWIFQFEHFFYEILRKWLQYRRSYHLKLEKYIYIGGFGMFSGAAEELTVTFIPYRYARVRKIVAFVTVTINFFCAGNQQCFFNEQKQVYFFCQMALSGVIHALAQRI